MMFRDRKGKWDTKFVYIIAGCKGDTETFRHELMHALYFVDEDYRDLVTSTFNSDVPAHLIKYVKTYMTSKGIASLYPCSVS